MAGYDRLANFVSRHPSLAMFRKFDHLNTKSLFHMQAEILYYEQLLKSLSKVHFERNPAEARRLDLCWEDLNNAAPNSSGAQQKELLLIIRQKLHVYHAALLQTARMQSLPQPERSDLDYFLEWLNREKGGDYFLEGVEADAWSLNVAPDLIAFPQGTKDSDSFAQLIGDAVVRYYHRLIGERFTRPDSEPGDVETWEYKQKVFVTMANVICMFLSAAIPTVTMFILYFMKNQGERLAFIGVMCFLCAAVMTFVVRGGRIDVFAATIAFAAVQAVFLIGPNFVP